RASGLALVGVTGPAAMDAEIRHGMGVLAQGLEGAARFASGAGRHGSFTDD
ncbi:enoyl-CoA hydratase, partial [Streptomyces sp. NPDC059627]